MRASADLGEIVMKSKTVQIMLLVGILSVPLAGVVQAEPNTIYVPDNYSTIQQAVNAANPGDTIVVRDGTYTENVNVNKDHLTIRSENGAETTIVRAENYNESAFEIEADYVEISGFTISRANTGIILREVSDCNISRNNVTNNSYGVWLYKVSNSTFNQNNISSNCWIGIELYSSTNNLIYLNNFIYNGNNIDASEGLTNTWNSPEPVTYTYKEIEYTNYLGNYWSDYTGGDSDEDGVGDTPYNINGDSDSHPLTGKFVENCITPEEFKVHNIDTGENFTNIKAAIDDANTLDGHVITIDAGEHYTSAKISKSLTIRSTSGNPADVTIYPVDPRDYVFTIVADHVEINGLTIQSPSMGIHLNGANYCDILNNVVSTHSTGIYVYGSSDNTITGNEISSGARGMYLYSARNNSINTNVFTNGSLYLYQSCLYLYQSWDNIIKNNSFANGGLEFYYKYNNDVQNNTVNGKPLVYLVRQTGLSVSDAGQVILMDCNNVTIQGLDLSNTPIGAALFSSVNCKVLDNTMLNNNVGAYLYYSLGNEIARNEIKSWVDCIRLSQYSSSNKIVNNVLRISGSRAITLERSSSNLINSNNILSERGEGSLEAGNWLGIVLRGSSNNTLTKNNVEHNLDRYKQNGCWTIGEGIGISLEQFWTGGSYIKSTGNLISTNTISYTRKGISLESSYDNTISDNNLACTGIYVYGSYRNTVSGNVATAEPNLYPAQHVESKPILYFEDATGQTIKDMDLAQLILVNCQNITVQNVDLNFGLQMLKTSNSEIKDNYVSAELLVRRASENGYIAETERLGVYLEESSNNLVSHNELSSLAFLTRGISLKYAQNNIIIKNNISGYWWPGYAIEKSSGNKIYLNNFYRSDDYDRFSDSQSINTWNSPEEITYTYNGNDYSNLLGNYWEDYTETDADGDGIGDTPYSIDSVTDNYPLVKPFPNYFRIVIDATAPPGGDGTPNNPYTTIGQGIVNAHYGDIIRVRAGSYRESISLPRGINLVGAGANITVIEGEGTGDVITAAHNTTIEGFTIKGSGPSEAGISIIEDSLYPGCTCNIRNNIITANYNGILLRNIWGGSQIVNNTIVKNSGSGVFFDYSYVSPTNNLITNNNYGIYCTNHSYPSMYYNNVWGNNLNYSGTSNPTGKNGNISSDPLLVDVGSDNYHLKLGSPCIDTGNPAGDYTGQTDIDGEPRVMNGRVDIGADEYPSSVSQFWTFDSDFQYNLDNDYATVEGTAHIRGTAGLSDAGLSVQAELTFNGPPAAVIPELYLIATDGPDRELAQQLVDPRYFNYSQVGPNTYRFSGFIPDVTRPTNNGHYEVAILVPSSGGKYYFFVNTDSKINSHYFRLTSNRPPNPPANLAQLKSDGTTEIPIGGTMDESTVIFKANISDPDGDRVKLQIELRQLDEYGGEFLSRFTQESDFFVASGSEVTVIAYGLVDGNYHWQARAVDEHGLASEWAGFGNNPRLDADLSVKLNYLPIATLTYSPDYPQIGEEILFDANQSRDPDGGNIVSYQWNFGDGNIVDGVQAAHIYTKIGHYTVFLIVRDDEETESQCFTDVVVFSPLIAEDINKIVDFSNNLLSYDIMDNAQLVAGATDYFSKEVAKDKIEIATDLAIKLSLSRLLGIRKISGLSVDDYLRLAERFPALAEAIDDFGWVGGVVTKTECEFLLKNIINEISSKVIDRLRADEYSFHDTFIPDLQANIDNKKSSLSELRNSTLGHLELLTQEEINLYRQDLRKRSVGNLFVSSYYMQQALLPTTFADLKKEDESDWKLKIAEPLWGFSLTLLSFCLGVPASGVTAEEIARDFYINVESLSTDARMVSLGSYVLNDSNNQADYIYQNTFQGLQNIVQRTAPGAVAGEIVSVENFGRVYFKPEPVHYNKWGSAFYKDIYSEAQVKNTGNSAATFMLYVYYIEPYTTYMLFPKIAERKYELPVAMTSDEQEIERGQSKTFTIWYKEDGEGINPKNQQIVFYLVAETNHGVYGLDYYTTSFGTTKIVINDVNVSEAELEKAQMYPYPIRSEPKRLLDNAYALLINIENPFEFPIEVNLTQDIPLCIEIISPGAGTIEGENISWFFKLGPEERKQIVATLVSTQKCGTIIEIPGATVKIYDRVNDRWLELSANDTSFETNVVSCPEAIKIRGYELVTRERFDETMFEYSFRVLAENTATRDIKDISLGLVSVSGNTVIIDDTVQCSLIEAGKEVLSDDTFKIRSDKNADVLISELAWQVYNCTHRARSDFNRDWSVDILDLAQFCESWLMEGVGMSEDLYPDCFVNFKDFVGLAEEWMVK